MFDFDDKYINILIQNIIKEAKVMFKLIKFGFIYLILSQIFISYYLNSLVYLYLFFQIFKDLFYLFRRFDLFRKQNLVKRIIRIITYQFFYFFLNFNLLCALFIKNLIAIILLSLIFTFYDFHSSNNNIRKDDTLLKHVLAYKRVEFDLYYNAYIGFIKLFLTNKFNIDFKNKNFIKDIQLYKYKKNIDIMVKESNKNQKRKKKRK